MKRSTGSSFPELKYLYHLDIYEIYNMGGEGSGISLVIYLVIFIMYFVSMELHETAGGGEESLARHSALHINITR